MAVGSSGGHIYPALAIAEQLEEMAASKTQNSSQKNLSPLQIHFVHSGSHLAKKILAPLPYPVHILPLGGLAKGQNFLRKITTIFQLPGAFIRSFLLIKKLKAQVVFGTGGAVTGPVLLMACLMRKKTAIWEGNSSLGLANKILSIFVPKIFTVFKNVKTTKKQILCGYPLRRNITQNRSHLQNSSQKLNPNNQPHLQNSPQNQNPNNQPHLQDSSQKPTPNNQPHLQNSLAQNHNQRHTKQATNQKSDFNKPFKVLILGGSQGSVFLNQVVSEALTEQDTSWRQNIVFYHQTGLTSFTKMKNKYQALVGVKAFSFSYNIQEYYKNCDVLFSRAGSGAIWEIALYGKSLVLVPLTHSAGGHQLNNAKTLAHKNYAHLILEKHFTPQTFKNKILQLKNNPQQRENLALRLKQASKGDGAKKIARWIFYGDVV